MSDLYFLEWMMIERMREVARQAEARSRLGLDNLPRKSQPGRMRRLVGAWLVRAGRRLQRAEPDPRRGTQPLLAVAEEGGRCAQL